MERSVNDIGYVGNGTGDEIFFGKRDVSTIEHTLSGAFIFKPTRIFPSGADITGQRQIMTAITFFSLMTALSNLQHMMGPQT